MKLTGIVFLNDSFLYSSSIKGPVR